MQSIADMCSEMYDISLKTFLSKKPIEQIKSVYFERFLIVRYKICFSKKSKEQIKDVCSETFLIVW